MLGIAFVWVGIPPDKARDKDLGTAAYLEIVEQAGAGVKGECGRNKEKAM